MWRLEYANARDVKTCDLSINLLANLSIKKSKRPIRKHHNIVKCKAPRSTALPPIYSVVHLVVNCVYTRVNNTVKMSTT